MLCISFDIGILLYFQNSPMISNQFFLAQRFLEESKLIKISLPTREDMRTIARRELQVWILLISKKHDRYGSDMYSFIF